MRKAVPIFLLFASCAAAQMVEGNIINSLTNAGIPRAGVHLEPASGTDSENTSYDTVTDALGHFAFVQIRPGTYQFSWFSSPYIAMEPPPLIHVAAGGEALKLIGRMTTMPGISGRVVDGNGEGIAGVHVRIDGSSVKGGGATTDGSGKFEAHLPSGRYSIWITPPDGIKPPQPEPGSDQVRVWTVVYYPGVTVREAAAKIVVHAGEQVAGIELKLLAVPAHAVRGMLFNADGTPAPNVTVALYTDEPRGGPDDKEQPAHENRTNSEGAFEFPPVPDGDWRVVAELERGGVKLRALEWIQMTGRNIEDVKLRLAPPFSVQGRVVMETQPGGPKDDLNPPIPPSVFLIPHAGRVMRESGAASWILQPDAYARPQFRSILYEGDGGTSADADREGKFTFTGVYGGAYRIAPGAAAPAGYYLDSVRVGGTEVGAAEVQLSPGTLPITVEYKTGGGVVRGSVEKCASGAVLLIPTDADTQWFGFLHSVRCDANDRYEIVAVRPGEYYGLAFMGRDSAPTVDADLLRQARRITVKAAETVAADLSAIPE